MAGDKETKWLGSVVLPSFFPLRPPIRGSHTIHSYSTYQSTLDSLRFACSWSTTPWLWSFISFTGVRTSLCTVFCSVYATLSVLSENDRDKMYVFYTCRFFWFCFPSIAIDAFLMHMSTFRIPCFCMWMRARLEESGCTRYLVFGSPLVLFPLSTESTFCYSRLLRFPCHALHYKSPFSPFYFSLYSSPTFMGCCTDLIFVSPDFVSQPPIHSIYRNLKTHAYHLDLGIWAICSSRTQSRPVCTVLGVSVHSLLIHLPTTLTSPNSLHSSRIEHHLDTVSPAVDRRPIDVRLYDIDHFVWRPSTW